VSLNGRFSLLRRHSQIEPDKRADIRDLLQRFRGAAGAMAGPGVDADEHRIAADILSTKPVLFLRF
jgi:hypothetical protein